MTRTEPRYRLIACEVLFRECAAEMAACSALVDPEFLPKALHDVGEAAMSAQLQEAIERTDAQRYDAILLAYGLCNNGVCGLHAPVPLVVPRAHDCITLLLGSRQRYAEYFAANPGTFYKSPGWLERDTDPNASPASITSRFGMIRDRDALAAQYGEENADFLMQAMGDWFQNYRQLTFIDTGVGDSARYLQIANSMARERSWEFERVTGSRALLQSLLSGNWPAEDFLVLKPGERIEPSWDERVVCAARGDGGK